MKYVPGNAQFPGARPALAEAFGFSDPNDAKLVRHAGFLAVAVDGGGAGAAGAQTATTAVQALLAAHRAKPESETIPDALQRAVRESLAAAAASDLKFAAVILDGVSLYWISAGGWIYLIRDGHLSAFATGGNELGLKPYPLQPGDRVLVATDGLAAAVPWTEIEPEFAPALKRAPQQQCEALIRKTVEKKLPGQDNVTVLCIGAEADASRSWMPFAAAAVALLLVLLLGWWWLHKPHPDDKKTEQKKENAQKKDENEKQQAKKEQEKQQQEAQKQPPPDQPKQEQSPEEQARQQQAKEEQAKQEQAKQELAKQEQAKQELARQEQAKQEQARQDQAKQAQAKQEQDRANQQKAQPSPPQPAAAAGRSGKVVYVNLNLMQIQPGTVTVGSNRDRNEMPVRTFKITKPFEISKYPVTQKQWNLIMSDNPSTEKGDDLPVEHVSYDGAMNFLRAFEKTDPKHIYRLPTEAEWIYASRAGAADDPSPEEMKQMAWLAENSDKHTHPVGQRKPNAWGLYDMYGNVAEWCMDWYDPRYYSYAPEADPQGPPTGANAVFHGCSYLNSPADCHSTTRVPVGRGGAGPTIGFRVVKQAR